jgi:anti-sigma regulatory factor (Ser/Thr protein kinase)
MTNALNASWGLKEVTPVALRLLANRERIIIEVWDRSPADPAAHQYDDEAEHGRGLAVVEALSNRWGFKRVSFSIKVVWCELVIGDARQADDG